MLLRCLSAIGSITAQTPTPTSYPKVLLTFADHLRKRRLDLKLTQYEASIKLKVTECTVFNWEKSKSEPKVKHYPDIINFLGYNPFGSTVFPLSRHELLKFNRTRLGLSYRNLGKILGVDGSTIAEWEEGIRPIHQSNLAKLEAWLAAISFSSAVIP